jgi:hypothetical protein
VGISRKFLDLIKKKYKDDLMDNLLQEEYSKTGPSQNNTQGKAMKKKKKKANGNGNSSNNVESLQQSSSVEKIMD